MASCCIQGIGTETLIVFHQLVRSWLGPKDRREDKEMETKEELPVEGIHSDGPSPVMAADMKGVIWEPGGEWENTPFSDTLIELVRVRHSADHQPTALLQGAGDSSFLL